MLHCTVGKLGCRHGLGALDAERGVKGLERLPPRHHRVGVERGDVAVLCAVHGWGEIVFIVETIQPS